MKLWKPYLFAATLIFPFSCSSNLNKQEDTSFVAHQTTGTDTLTEVSLWADSLVLKYLDNNSERLTEVDGYEVTYMKDYQIRNGKNYAAIKIGHSFEYKYVTDQWLYIDSLTHEIFEYDLPNDTLIKWEAENN